MPGQRTSNFVRLQFQQAAFGVLRVIDKAWTLRLFKDEDEVRFGLSSRHLASNTTNYTISYLNINCAFAFSKTLRPLRSHWCSQY